MLKLFSINIFILGITLLVQDVHPSLVSSPEIVADTDDLNISGDDGDFGKKDSVEPKNFEQNVNEVIKIKDLMENAGLIRDNTGVVNKVKTSATVQKIKEKAKAIDTDKIDSAVEGIKGAGEGLLKLVEGIKGGSWVDIVTGGLDMISSVLGMLGPMGALASSVLSIFSMIFGLFGGATGGEESTEDMMTRVIEKALLESKTEELKSEVNGIKRLLKSFSSSIANFRETNNITYDQALAFYDQGFRGVPTFGVLEHYIGKWCSVGDANTYDSAAQKADLKDKVTRCLDMVNLYCDLSVLRQIMLADMASLIAEVGIKGTPEVFMHLLRKEQKYDKSLLKFLLDPINNRDKRFVINKYFTSLNKYSTITSYLKKLSQVDVPVTKKKATRAEVTTQEQKIYEKKFALVCSDVELKGDCFQFDTLGTKQQLSMKGWRDKIVSLYVSDGVEVKGYHRDDLSGSLFGPYFGPSVYGKVMGQKQWRSMNIVASTKNALNHMRFCEKENMDTEGVCESIAIRDYSNLGAMDIRGVANSFVSVTSNRAKCNSKCEWHHKGYFWCYYRGSSWDYCLIGRNWSNKIKSMYIPSGYYVFGYTQTSYRGTRYGPFYGPSTILSVHPSARWQSLKITKTEVTTSKMVQVCSEEGLKGFCDYFRIKTWFTSLENVHGINWKTDKRIKSMMIPGGVTAHIYSGENYEGIAMGPYVGPSTINKVDGADGENRIKSIRLTEDY